MLSTSKAQEERERRLGEVMAARQFKWGMRRASLWPDLEVRLIDANGGLLAMAQKRTGRLMRRFAGRFPSAPREALLLRRVRSGPRPFTGKAACSRSEDRSSWSTFG